MPIPTSSHRLVASQGGNIKHNKANGKATIGAIPTTMVRVQEDLPTTHRGSNDPNHHEKAAIIMDRKASIMELNLAASQARGRTRRHPMEQMALLLRPIRPRVSHQNPDGNPLCQACLRCPHYHHQPAHIQIHRLCKPSTS